VDRKLSDAAANFTKREEQKQTYVISTYSNTSNSIFRTNVVCILMQWTVSSDKMPTAKLGLAETGK